MENSSNNWREFESEKFRVTSSGNVYYSKSYGDEVQIGRVDLDTKSYNGEPDSFSLFDPQDAYLQQGASSIQAACKNLLDNYIQVYSRRNKTAARIA